MEDVNLDRLDEIIAGHEGQKGALIPILQEIQEVCGYLPEIALRRVSEKTKIPLSNVYGVTTFYAQFYLTRRGRNSIRVCRGTACHVRGGKTILKLLKQHIGIEEGETSSDFKFSLETVACLGACALSPVMMVNKTYFGKINRRRVETVINQCK
jgi:NADH-quinone oxidoreductase subunit E